MKATFESAQFSEATEHDARIDTLTRDILTNPAKEKMYRDMMWQFVGDPDTAHPGTSQPPYPIKTWNNELHTYATYVGGFFVHEEDDDGEITSKLFGIRSIEPLDNASEYAKNYMIIEYDLVTGEYKEPVVHRVKKTGTKDQPDWTWQLIDTKLYENWPPGSAPGLHAPPHEQNILSIPTGQPASIRDAFSHPSRLHDIAPLIKCVNEALIERDGQLEVVQRELGAVAIIYANQQLIAA